MFTRTFRLYNEMGDGWEEAFIFIDEEEIAIIHTGFFYDNMPSAYYDPKKGRENDTS